MSLSIIHFSDIHINDSSDLILTRINKLKMACVSSLPSQGDVVLAVSGDIAYSGKKEQYDLAASMLNEIEQYIKQEKGSEVHVVCVPGNHDCDFKTGSPAVRTALIDSARQMAIDNDYYNAVKEVQSEYDCFAKGYGIDTSQTLPTIEIAVADQKVRFLLLNTAWMSVLKETPGQIVMPHKLFPDFKSNDCKVVFCMYHHPDSWLNPDCKRGFVDYVRVHADMILIGHEHMRDSYEKVGDSFSVYCSYGKELQDSNGDSSAFTVLNFDEAIQNYDVVDFVWDNDGYIRKNSKTNQYHKNIAAVQTVYHPKREIIDAAEDIGIAINHFAKEEVKLSDLFVLPDVNKCDYHNEKKATKTIRRNVVNELSGNTLNIMIGGSSSGKTAFAKSLFLLEESKDTCCLLLSGNSFNSSDEAKIRETVENGFKQQYNAENLEQFNQLPKNKRVVIVDDFDLIKLNRDRRIKVLDYLCGFFGRVTIFMSSSMEMPTILTSNYVMLSKQLIYYEILPLGNAKRKELISKWYHLNENSLTEEEIAARIENARNQIDTFLGNGAAFIPAMPVFIIGTLQNGDAIKQTLSGSKYGFLYESLIGSSLAKVSKNYNEAGMYNIDESILSKLAFDMLYSGHTSFTEDQLSQASSEIGKIYLLQLSPSDFLSKLIDANIVRFDPGEGAYRFKYPYIFYYFAGRYIAYNLKEPTVNEMIERMSTRLYNETYGNIIIFVCHFAGSNDVIDSILLNAYGTLENYIEFDFTKANPIFEEIKEMVDALIPSTIASDSDVEANKQRALVRMDEVGINDGHVNEGEIIIDDEITEKEREMAAVSSALKTIEVLGQILQNYPVAVKGEEKLEIITEMHKLGMRSVQAIINTMGYLEKDLVEYIMERAMGSKVYMTFTFLPYPITKGVNRSVRVKKKGARLYAAIRWMVKLCYPRIQVSGQENLPDESALIIGNHSQMNGPIVGELYVPGAPYIWCAGEMMHLKDVPEYAFRDFWSQKSKWTRPFYKLLSYLIAPIAVCIFNNARTIGVYHDARILSTFKNTVRKLEEGKSVVIFPEHDVGHNHIVSDFQDKFVDIAKLYYKKTGRELHFVPMYIAPKLKQVCLGKPVQFCADEPMDIQRGRICNYLMDEITAIAETLPEHTVVPYRNIPKKDYPSSYPKESLYEKTGD